MQGKADNAYPSASPAVPAGAPATRTYPPGGAAPAMPPGAIVGRDAVANAV